MNKIFIALALLAVSCSKEMDSTKEISFPVNVVKSVKKDMPIFLDSIGHVESFDSVIVRSRVEGELQKVHFKEGDEVEKDQIIFTIDPRPFEAELKFAEGQLAENIANLAISKDRLERNVALVKSDFISKIDFDQLKANVERNDALVRQSAASVEKAHLNVEYCHITSPIKGVTGLLQKDLGNLIIIDDVQPIISIHQINPIYVVFSIPEIDLPQVQDQGPNLELKVAYDDLKHPVAAGKLNVIDNGVDKDTGTIKLRAIFENLDKKLWPGQFVKTRLNLYTQKDAIVIPYETIEFTTDGPIVYVVKEDNTVEKRIVQLGAKGDDDVIINHGIAENETIVRQGQLNLFQGASVTIEEEEK